MKKSYLNIGMFILFMLISCKKDDNKLETENKCYQLTVSRNDKVYQVFKFNNNNLLSQLSYDTLGVLKEKIYFTYSSQKIRKDYFSRDSVLQSSMIYKLNSSNYVDSIYTYSQPANVNDSKHAYIFNYSENNKLALIMFKIFASGEHFDINFKWLGNNVAEKKFPFNSGYAHYSYEYDNNPSIFKLLNAPVDVNIGDLEIAEIPISSNNIKKVNVKKLVNNDFTFDTVKYELYNSQMTYNSNGYLKTEIRKYSDVSVKFDYKLDTLKY